LLDLPPLLKICTQAEIGNVIKNVLANLTIEKPNRGFLITIEKPKAFS
jgi:hypothetical protein